MKKLFAVLEQGNLKNSPLAQKHRDQFTSDYCDFFRLNWDTPHDKEADFFQDHIFWSEGRSLLYEKTKGMYEYYIFIDDDLEINSVSKLSPRQELKLFLEKYKPLNGTFRDPRWSWHPDMLNEKNQVDAFCIASFDLQCHFFHHEFADLMFPIVYHGSARCMWYAQYVAWKLAPRKCLTANNIQLNNTQQNPHQDWRWVTLKESSPNINDDYIQRSFQQLCYEDDFGLWNCGWRQKTNRRAYSLTPDSSRYKVTHRNIGKIFNNNHENWKNRTSLIR